MLNSRIPIRSVSYPREPCESDFDQPRQRCFGSIFKMELFSFPFLSFLLLFIKEFFSKSRRAHQKLRKQFLNESKLREI